MKLGGPIVFLSGVDNFWLHFDYFFSGTRNCHITRVPLETYIDYRLQYSRQTEILGTFFFSNVVHRRFDAPVQTVRH